MTAAWREVRLAELCEGIYDGPHATPQKTQAGPIFLGISSLQNGRLDLTQSGHVSEDDFVRWTRRVTPQGGDVVFSYETRLGQAAIIPEGLRCCLGRRLGLLRPRRDVVDPRFLLYAYLAPAFQEVIRSRTVHGSTVDRILLEEIGSFALTVPALSEQRAIARVLGALDDKIELNRRTSETLEALASALFSEHFASDRGEAGARPLTDFVDVNPTRSLRAGRPAPYLDMGNMPTRTARALGWITREAGSGARFVNGDTLVARITPCLENGKTAFVDFLTDGEVGWGSTEYIVLRPRDPLPPEWAYLLARTEAFRSFAISHMNGSSGRQRVPADCFARFMIRPPDVEVAAAFGETVRPLFARMRAADEESRTLAELRDTLLPCLLSGELRIRDAEREVALAT